MCLASTVAGNALWISLGSGFTGLIIGVVSAVLCCVARRSPAAASDSAPSKLTLASNDAARADMAAHQLRDVAQAMSVDVASHNKALSNFTSQLSSTPLANFPDAVAAAVDEMLAANSKLQSRLDEAERKIDNQAQELKIQHSEARTDALTGLANRRAFDEALKDCGGRFHSDQQPYSLVLLDVDHFKQLNDTLGHVVGDDILRSVAASISAAVSANELVCRYGGEEFAIVLPGVRAAEAQIVAERLRSRIENASLPSMAGGLRVTASFGVAEVIEGETYTETVRRADDAVYASKRAGRNLTHWHDGQTFHLVQLEPTGSPNRRRGGPRPGDRAAAAERPGCLTDSSGFYNTLTRQLAENRRTGAPLSVIQLAIADVDQLEVAIRAQALENVATCLRSSVRDMDLLARLEDDQFVLMLPRTTASAASIVAQRLRARVESQRVRHKGGVERLRLNLGIAATLEGDTAERLMKRAQVALQQGAIDLEETVATSSAV